MTQNAQQTAISREKETSQARENRQAEDARRHLEMISSRTKNDQLSTKYCNMAIKFSISKDEKCRAYYNRAMNFFKDKQFSWALADFKDAKKLDSKNKHPNIPRYISRIQNILQHGLFLQRL